MLINNNSFILAWGNEKSMKRSWLESHGFEAGGMRSTIEEINDFFNRAPVDIQSHMNQLGWL